MRVTILFLALIVGGYVVDDGHPTTGYVLIGIAFWEAVFQEYWSRAGHWSHVAFRRAFVSVFYAGVLALALIANFKSP